MKKAKALIDELVRSDWETGLFWWLDRLVWIAIAAAAGMIGMAIITLLMRGDG